MICISTHTGSSSPTGHYTARCLTENNVYYYFSDTERYQINEDKIFGGDPYILFYKRINKEESINNYNIILKNQIINIDKEKFEKLVEKREQNNKKEEEKEDKKKKKGKKEEKDEDKNQKKEEEEKKVKKKEEEEEEEEEEEKEEKEEEEEKEEKEE